MLATTGQTISVVGIDIGKNSFHLIGLDDRPKRAVVQQWESMEAMMKWYKSPEYQEALKIGSKYATFRRYAWRPASCRPLLR